MANYLCRATNPRVPDYLVKKVSVPTGATLHAGDIVILKALDSTIADNYQVYTGTKPAADDLKLRAAIIINDGFETLADGRRPDGQPDYTQYVYQAGDIVTAIMLVPGLDFELSKDVIDGAFAAGQYIEPVADSNKGAVKATRTADTKSALMMLGQKNFRMGGMFGYQFIETVIATVVD